MSPSFPSSRGDNTSSSESKVVSAVERAVREKRAGATESDALFSHEEHLSIAKSGAADLSSEEKFGVFERIHATPLAAQSAEPHKQTPLFFGSWTGMNPFRFVKPFFVQRKKP